MKCPYCQSTIEDDSRWCDQCGKELKFCPSCRVPRKGNSCPACGELLVSANQFFSSGLPDSRTPSTANQAQSSDAGPTAAPEPIATQSSPARPALRLSGNGMILSVREGIFGRRGGIMPELASCSYVSGTHGELKFFPAKNCWGIKDCGSTNGTFIDGTRLERDKWYILNPGSRLRIATLDFIVEQA